MKFNSGRSSTSLHKFKAKLVRSQTDGYWKLSLLFSFLDEVFHQDPAEILTLMYDVWGPIRQFQYKPMRSVCVCISFSSRSKCFLGFKNVKVVLKESIQASSLSLHHK